MKFLKLLVMAASVLAGTSANANLINFIDMADGTEWGESGFDLLSVGIMNVDATQNGTNAFAYLDRGNAGLGVCGQVNSQGKKGNSGRNQCSSGAGDDNITTGEALQFTFDVDVLISNIWFNNNHDHGFSTTPQDQVTIEAIDYNAVLGYAGDSNQYSTWFISAGDVFDVSFKNEQFYVSAIEFTAASKPGESNAVPVTGTLSLVGLGLAFVGGSRRRSKQTQ